MQIALKIDVDTYRGIEDGAARLASFLHSQKIPASFFVSLGPDASGRAITRVFRHRGFLKKMKRTSALSLYGLRTVLSGTVLPARPMGTSFSRLFRRWRDWGFEVSPHGYDHILWHDQAAEWDEPRATSELEKITSVYRHIFNEDPTSFAAPGWQAGPGTWRAMEKIKLLYHSDTRGDHPYFGASLQTLEIPTTLPTWDEMLTWDGVDRRNIADETRKLLKSDRVNVWTVHSELEGTAYFPQFHEFVERVGREGVTWIFLPNHARTLLESPREVPYDEIEQGTRPGRAGTVTCQVSHG
jgi:peptidoglycan/xylan/chitin deacetylase (PgdA/CDA1 family)